eukprot:11620.XXX_355764_355946_1 [CDS] Oithona nana genome sequencing.
MFIYENLKIGSKNCEFYAKSKFTPGAKNRQISMIVLISVTLQKFSRKKIVLNFSLQISEN